MQLTLKNTPRPSYKRRNYLACVRTHEYIQDTVNLACWAKFTEVIFSLPVSGLLAAKPVAIIMYKQSRITCLGKHSQTIQLVPRSSKSVFLHYWSCVCTRNIGCCCCLKEKGLKVLLHLHLSAPLSFLSFGSCLSLLWADRCVHTFRCKFRCLYFLSY